MNTFGINLHRMNKTPPPQIFSPSRDDQHNQAKSQCQYRNPFSKQGASPWQRDHYLDDHSDGNAGFISGFGLTPNTPPDDGSSPSSLGQGSQYSTVDSYGSSNTNYSEGLDSIDSGSMQSGSIPLVASPDGFAAATFSPTLSHHRSGSAAQAAIHTTHLPDDYFAHNPIYSQYPVRQEHQPASGPQDPEPYPGLNTGSLVPAPPPPLPPPPPPPPPYRRTRRGGGGGAAADQPNPSPYQCGCGATFGRRTDLERHRETAKKHDGDQRGLACPVKGCRFTSRFTRVDNFRTHCRKQHEISVDKINTYIRERKERTA